MSLRAERRNRAAGRRVVKNRPVPRQAPSSGEKDDASHRLIGWYATVDGSYIRVELSPQLRLPPAPAVRKNL